MTINAVPILIVVLCLYAIAYRFYSAFLAAKVLALDDRLAADARFLFFGMAAMSAIGMPVRAYPGILLAQERFYWVSIGQGVMPWVQLVVFTALLHGGDDNVLTDVLNLPALNIVIRRVSDRLIFADLNQQRKRK